MTEKSKLPPALQEIETRPLDHRFVISAGENMRLLGLAGVFLIGGGIAADILESKKKYAEWITGNALFFYLLGVVALIGAFACWHQNRLSQREIAKMAAGDYLARWKYTPEQWNVFKSLEIGIQSSKVKTIFWILFILFGVLGLASGVLAALNKSPWWTPLVWLPIGLGIGTGIWAVFVLPFKILSGTYNRILERRDYEPEVIFTRNGVYSTGRFFQVNDAGYEKIESHFSRTLPKKLEAPRLAGVLGIRVTRGMSRQNSQRGTVAHTQHYLVQEGQEEVAEALVKMFPPAEES